MEIVFASNNEHKLQEIRQIAGDRFKVLSLADIGCDADITEDGDTLEANARIKARYVASRYGRDCFADDTGLEVEALDGAPGVHSARFAPGAGHDSAANTALLLEKLEGKDNRRARFRTAICLIMGGEEHMFEGIVDGEITTTPAGKAGFGYDPVFRPDGWTATFADASAEEKNSVSHRRRALDNMMKFLDEKID
ncbi:MAG: RdgB/HAM1 family non-canonical purine NTP pyrophosphatase [Bacteroides sp.]|nr:RdgB/HAM1 family non-canonical purine NTP pyrophosphatase [Bacteroides sp.]MCM1456883.1 RdgB/HAM1 family non-canonical purine NTP pyrophosphatase [Lachnoclostridium sp.]